MANRPIQAAAILPLGTLTMAPACLEDRPYRTTLPGEMPRPPMASAPIACPPPKPFVLWQQGQTSGHTIYVEMLDEKNPRTYHARSPTVQESDRTPQVLFRIGIGSGTCLKPAASPSRFRYQVTPQ